MLAAISSAYQRLLLPSNGELIQQIRQFSALPLELTFLVAFFKLTWSVGEA